MDNGILIGYEDKTIRPDRRITRIEAITLISKAVGLEPSDSDDIKLEFLDDKEIPKWSKGYLKAALDKGIAVGYPDNSFKPDRPITRVEMVVMVNKAFDLGKSPNRIEKFKDFNEIPVWANEYISKAFELKLITGYQDSFLRPNQEITRAEAFAIIANSLSLK